MSGASPDRLQCGVFVAPLVEPGYLAASIRYSFPIDEEDLVVREVLSPMAGVIMELPYAPLLIRMLKDLADQVAQGKAEGFSAPFLCGEVGHCQAMYSVETDVFLVGFGVVAGYFTSLEMVWEPFEQTLAMIKESSPWSTAPVEWIQRFGRN